MFLTPAELHDLTGYKKPSLQRKWLVDNHYRFDVRKDGRPALLWAQVNARGGIAVSRTAKMQPNWDGI